jgi:hypothetical protein
MLTGMGDLLDSDSESCEEPSKQQYDPECGIPPAGAQDAAAAADYSKGKSSK